MAGNLNIGNIINLLKPKNIEDVKGLIQAYSSFLSPEQHEKLQHLITELENPNGPNKEHITNLTDSLKQDIDSCEAAQVLKNENISVPSGETMVEAMAEKEDEYGKSPKNKEEKRERHEKRRKKHRKRS